MAKITAKKSASAKTASKKKSTIKYADKSADQPEMVVIFNKLVQLFTPYEKGSIHKIGGKNGQVTLISKKQIEVAGKKMEEVWFVAALVQKGFVGFYYMPIYGFPELGKKLQPELMKCLKGKSCFHIKKDDAQLFNQIKEALKIGYDCYKENGWLS